jgi:hypothetical protein
MARILIIICTFALIVPFIAMTIVCIGSGITQSQPVYFILSAIPLCPVFMLLCVALDAFEGV